MNREKQIKKAAKKYLQTKHKKNLPYVFAEDVFEDGAWWADEHPKSPWISVEERLPNTDEDGASEEILLLKNGIVTLGNYFCDEDRRIKWITWEGGFAITPTHWMPIPKLPNVEPKK